MTTVVRPNHGDSSVPHLEHHFNSFALIAKSKSSRRNENSFLMYVMYHPLTNTVVGFCNNALSVLYTVSPTLIADVRRVLKRLCSDPSFLGFPLREDERKIYHAPPCSCCNSALRPWWEGEGVHENRAVNCSRGQDDCSAIHDS